jgi:dihydropteroate synthase
MGIVNVTPDSFSDGGRHDDAGRALAHCEKLLAEGADILDIGGESTRPGAAPVPLDAELRRVLPVLEGALKFGVPLSVDTVKPEVMRRALECGADIVNDINALRLPGAEEAVAALLAHLRAQPPQIYVTHLSKTPDGDRVTLWEGDAGYDAWDASIPGPRHRLVMAKTGFVFDDSGRPRRPG